MLLFSFAEVFFVYSAKGASKILGKIFEFCAGSDSVFGGADFFIIFPTAYITYIFHS